MEVTSTFELRRGAEAPAFELPDGSGSKKYSLADLAKGKEAVVIVFACNHCPYVKHLASDLGAFAEEYKKRGVQFIVINSNDAKKFPDDAPGKMEEFAKANHWKFPYLYDATQEVAQAYSAACTPDFFVFNGDLILTYGGQYDGSRPGNGAPMTGADLRAALESTLRYGQADAVRMRPSSGCNIKWKKNGAPEYYRRLQKA